ncbi:hypothetical protein ERJ75_001266000 [Trypanosoma vivax]|nr:hypothetical protein ERJ75_001266000 [Trypanosoma vivax]
MQAMFFLAVLLAAAGTVVRDGNAAAGETVMEFRALCRLATELDAFRHLNASALWGGKDPVTQIEETLNNVAGGGGGKGHADAALGQSSVASLNRQAAKGEAALRGKHAPREAKGRANQGRPRSDHYFAKRMRPKAKRRQKSIRQSFCDTKLCGGRKVVRWTRAHCN